MLQYTVVPMGWGTSLDASKWDKGCLLWGTLVRLSLYYCHGYQYLDLDVQYSDDCYKAGELSDFGGVLYSVNDHEGGNYAR